MNRGEVWWVNFDPAVGGEIRKRRPAVILSNDSANKHLNRVQVVPLTAQVSKLYPSEAAVTIAGRPNKAMADQLTTASKERLTKKMGQVSREELDKIERAIAVQLGLQCENGFVVSRPLPQMPSASRLRMSHSRIACLSSSN